MAPPLFRLPAAAPRRLVAGVVATNEERSVGPAIRSLLTQSLPPGVLLTDVWVVASGCTDRTVPEVQRVAAEDPRVHLLVEPVRRGKSAAVGEVLRRAEGDLVVLLNADARAEPGALDRLLRQAEGCRPPFGIMARPVPPVADRGFAGALGLLWGLHHALHLRLLGTGRGNHLSDELVLFSTSGLPPLPPETVNDGSFLAGSIARTEGTLIYAPEARVAVSVPGNFRDHVKQRRRILFGHHQVGAAMGTPTTTFPQFALRSPREAVGLLFRTTLAMPRGLRHLVVLGAAESVAFLLSLWDRVPPERDHVRWERVPEAATAGVGSAIG